MGHGRGMDRTRQGYRWDMTGVWMGHERGMDGTEKGCGWDVTGVGIGDHGYVRDTMGMWFTNEFYQYTVRI